MHLSARHYLLLPILALALPSCFAGPTELFVIAGVLLLLFGGTKLPQMMRGMGSGINEFKKGLKEGEGEEDEDDDKKKSLPDKDA